MTTIADNLHKVRERIDQACARFGRDARRVQLLAVSKTVMPERVLEAARAGQLALGENYVQEGVEKIQAMAELDADLAPRLQWHAIGPLQSNKTRLVAERFHWVHSVERLKIAQRLSEQRPDGLAPLQVCIQVNVDGGPSKSGVAPDEVAALAFEVAQLPRLQLRGLMCIPEPAPSFEAACAVFQRARELFESLQISHAEVDTLSMGMSQDLEAAIASGSTLVRVGSAIFGARPGPAGV